MDTLKYKDKWVKKHIPQGDVPYTTLQDDPRKPNATVNQQRKPNIQTIERNPHRPERT